MIITIFTRWLMDSNSQGWAISRYQIAHRNISKFYDAIFRIKNYTKYQKLPVLQCNRIYRNKLMDITLFSTWKSLLEQKRVKTDQVVRAIFRIFFQNHGTQYCNAILFFHMQYYRGPVFQYRPALAFPVWIKTWKYYVQIYVFIGRTGSLYCYRNITQFNEMSKIIINSLLVYLPDTSSGLLTQFNYHQYFYYQHAGHWQTP